MSLSAVFGVEQLIERRKMKRQRPVPISAACMFLFFIHLFPTAPLLQLAFTLLEEFNQGGSSQLYSAYKASVKTEQLLLLARVSLALFGVLALWAMKPWAFVPLTIGVGWGLVLHFQAGSFSLLSFKLPIIALVACFYYYFRKSVNKVHRPEVHYYDSGVPQQVHDKSVSNEAPPVDSDGKSAVDDLLY